MSVWIDHMNMTICLFRLLYILQALYINYKCVFEDTKRKAFSIFFLSLGTVRNSFFYVMLQLPECSNMASE
jgi:hypothetical protein